MGQEDMDSLPQKPKSLTPAQYKAPPPAAQKGMDLEDADDSADDEKDDNKKGQKAAPEKPLGPKTPRRVASAAINKSALYHFQK